MRRTATRSKAVLLAAMAVVLGLEAPAAGLMQRPPDVDSRGDYRGQRERGERERGQTPAPEEGASEPADECPTELWSVPIEVKGVACILIAKKPPEDAPAGP
jgi:hypothetical protein